MTVHQASKQFRAFSQQIGRWRFQILGPWGSRWGTYFAIRILGWDFTIFRNPPDIRGKLEPEDVAEA